MKISAEEHLMYNVMKAIYESGIPITLTMYRGNVHLMGVSAFLFSLNIVHYPEVLFI